MGLELRARVNAASHYDDFEAANGTFLDGRALPRGGAPWTMSRATDTTTRGVIQSGVAKAAAGTGSTLVMFNPGFTNFDIVATLAARATSPVPSITFRSKSVDETYQLALRTDTATPNYSIWRRLSTGTGSLSLASGVAPAAGDRIHLSMREGVATVRVNGVQIMQATLSSYADQTGVGMNFNGTDVTTGFTDFNYYGR